MAKNIATADFEELFAIVNEIVTESKTNTRERRISDRVVVMSPVELHYLDENGEFIGDKQDALMHDLSYGGMGILCAEPALGKKAILRFNEFESEKAILVDIRFEYEAGIFYRLGASFNADWSYDF